MITLTDKDLFKTKGYINGQWVESSDQTCFDVDNPATGEVIATVARCGSVEARSAIEAAHTAYGSWRQLTALQRADYLYKWYELIMAHLDDLAYLLTAEQGKPLVEAGNEIRYGAAYIRWFAEEARRIYGDTIPQAANDKRLVCIKQPVGVVACITPWNFPNAMLTRKIAPALAAGCTVVCKPAGSTPLSALALAELAHRAGIPAGVVNVVAGSTRAIGNELTANPLVRKLTFTGSTRVGKTLIKACADTVKKTSMELGGNAPFIVFDDADPDAAVAGAIVSKYRNAGQTCVCSNRLLVQSGIYDTFMEKFTDAVQKMKLGPGTEQGVAIGPMITTDAVNDVDAMVQDAVDKGASIVTGGKRSGLGARFYEPTILGRVTTDMQVFREEIFGPVAPVIRFETEAEAIQMANDTEFGLAAYFYSRDIGRVWRVAEELEYGIVGINEGLVSNEAAPFGGIKESGNGREGSKYGLDDYLEIKYLCMGGMNK
ncbi:MAG: NAD-dependent succinate-semialdehyde dehydrogenase [Desulfobacterales bacterium]|nr:NAD-dependent succinate-semialdehyde dehydrogenase [Desulfobacterales bacterium]